jgi:hypothetical protein
VSVYPEVVKIEASASSVPEVMSLKLKRIDGQRIDSVILKTLLTNVIVVPAYISYYLSVTELLTAIIYSEQISLTVTVNVII